MLAGCATVSPPGAELAARRHAPDELRLAEQAEVDARLALAIAENERWRPKRPT